MCFDRMEFTRILRLHGLRPKNERRISMKKHPLLRTALLVMTAAALLCVSALAVEDGAPANSMYGTFWALVPPVIAITLALITKEAYSSLFIGVTVGALFSQGFSPIGALNMIVNDGLVAAIKDNAGIFLFLVLLGIIVALVNAAGGSAAFGRWASKNIKTKVGASLATFLLGILIFIDDYFNCLTVGTVMRPVTDSHRISRPKLAYLLLGRRRFLHRRGSGHRHQRHPALHQGHSLQPLLPADLRLYHRPVLHAVRLRSHAGL